jgi:hypothetical protein
MLVLTRDHILVMNAHREIHAQGSSQNSADTFTDNNEEKHSAVEASNSAATTLIRGIMMILLAVNRNAIKQY